MSRNRRRSRAETADLVRGAAVSLLEQHGLQGFANSVRLDDALQLLQERDGIRLTHGSIYGRIWDDQRDFQLDVVATTLARYRGDDVAAAVAGGIADGGEVELRLRRGLTRGAASARVSRRWNLWLGARTAAVSTPDQEDDERLAAALATVGRQVDDSMAAALLPVLVGEPVPTIALDGTPAEESGAGVAPGVTAFVALLIGLSLSPAVSGTDPDGLDAFVSRLDLAGLIAGSSTPGSSFG